MKTEPRGMRNKNPLNIRWCAQNNWRGQTGKDEKGFAVFASNIYGFRAATILVKKYIARGQNTIQKIVSTWAPEADGNDVKAYVDYVSKKTSIPADKPITIYERGKVCAILKAMAQFECGTPYNKSIVELGYDLAITGTILNSEIKI